MTFLILWMTQLVCLFVDAVTMDAVHYQDDMDMVQSDDDEKHERGIEEDKGNSSPTNQVPICC